MKRPRTDRQRRADRQRVEDARHKPDGPCLSDPRARANYEASVRRERKLEADRLQRWRVRAAERLKRWMRTHLAPAEMERQLREAAYWQEFFSPEAKARRLREQLDAMDLQARAAQAVAEREARWRAEGGDE